MSVRELVVLGTASQVPTRERNHNGYLLRFDTEGILFDPGEGTQRQMIHAGVRASSITRICITHLHGDHSLGLAGVLQRLSLDRVPHPVHLHYPASGQAHIDHLRRASVFEDHADVREQPTSGGVVVEAPPLTLTALPLRHSVETLGWRIDEPDSRRMLPDRLEALGVRGPAIGELQRTGVGEGRGGRRVTLDDVSEERPGQSVAFVMDTALCDAAFELAADVDLLVCESTFLDRDAELAEAYGHLTAAQAARIAVEAGARRLVLTHFSQRYPDLAPFDEEARAVFDDVTIARDLARVGLPPRRRPGDRRPADRDRTTPPRPASEAAPTGSARGGTAAGPP